MEIKILSLFTGRKKYVGVESNTEIELYLLDTETINCFD
jgi:hypothetical protein